MNNNYYLIIEKFDSFLLFRFDLEGYFVAYLSSSSLSDYYDLHCS